MFRFQEVARQYQSLCADVSTIPGATPVRLNPVMLLQSLIRTDEETGEETAMSDMPEVKGEGPEFDAIRAEITALLGFVRARYVALLERRQAGMRARAAAEAEARTVDSGGVYQGMVPEQNGSRTYFFGPPGQFGPEGPQAQGKPCSYRYSERFSLCKH